MIVLLNMIVPVVVVGLLYAAYKFKTYWPLVIMVAVLFIYPMIQPSYMPKGTVKPIQNVEFKQLDIPIVDRSLKPKSAEQYDLERNALLDEIDEKINKQIEINKNFNQQMKLNKE